MDTFMDRLSSLHMRMGQLLVLDPHTAAMKTGYRVARKTADYPPSMGTCILHASATAVFWSGHVHIPVEQNRHCLAGWCQLCVDFEDYQMPVFIGTGCIDCWGSLKRYR